MTGTHTGSRTDSLGASSSDKVADRAKSAVGSAADTVKESSSELTTMATERAGEVAHKAADKADDRKAELAKQARTLQEKAAQFATSITDEQPQVGRALEKATDKAEGLISWIESTPVEEMAQEASAQMRRHPMLFAAGMFGVGFALSRVLKPVDPSTNRELTTTSSASMNQLPMASPTQGGMH